MRIVRLVAGFLLLPLCFAAAKALFGILLSSHPDGAGAATPAEWAIVMGFGLWLFLYFTLPRPVRSYILAHELTHALWAWMSGAVVHGIKVAEDSGSVVLSKSNFLVMLAPYFFPLYTVIVIAAYCILSIFLPVADYYVFWFGLIGLTWGFHFTFTISTLLQHQTDIRDCGYVFSYTFIFFLNVLGILVWIVVVSDVTLEETVGIMSDETRIIAAYCSEAFAHIGKIVGQ
jgi:hypothetical protein